MALTIVIVLFVTLAGLVFLGRVSYTREHNEKANGTYALKYVWVEDDGSVRRLNPDEVEYLNTQFHPGDGARPYIKSNYATRSPDGRMSGFLPRAKLPSYIVVK
ncbi:MAG: hypothetical protein H6R10_339 [Rhodocyclaceae bacterium]|nr:hypothetical protein [Rhodocyclaceae bacterium]